MSPTKKAHRYLSIPAIVAVGALALTSPAHASGGTLPTSSSPQVQTVQASEAEFDLGISDAEFEAAIEYASAQVSDPVAEPEQFEAAVQEFIDTEVNAGGDDAGYGTMALPAVIIAARFAGCVAGAYSSLAAINPNSSQAHIAGQIANAVVGCVGGGVSAQIIQRWIMNNPRAVGIALNAIGLGSLSGSSSQASMSIEITDEGRFATLAA